MGLLSLNSIELMEDKKVTLLIIGVLLWSVVHLMPAVPMGLRATLERQLGEGPYKGLAGLAILVSVLLMVFGWKALPGDFIYELPDIVDTICGLAMLAMSILFFAPYMKTNIRRHLRHPQLFGIILWGLGHILASGQVRSLILFGGIGLWAWIEMLLINRRDGAWEKPERASFKDDFKLLIAGLGFFLIFVFTHEGLFGVSVIPGSAAP